MRPQPFAQRVSERLQTAARRLGTVNPLPFVKPILDRTFSLPEGDSKYASSTLTPGAAPLESSFSEQEPDTLRFTIEPLGPSGSPAERRDETTREMRRVIAPVFGRDALRWFDQASEDWRGLDGRSRLSFGAYYGSSYDRNGMVSSKAYYEMNPGQIGSLPHGLGQLARVAMEMLPGLFPIFTSIACKKEGGSQRATFVAMENLRLVELQPMLQRFGLAQHLPGLMRMFGLALGGRFELPKQSVLLALGQTPEGPELELYVLLGMLPDLPNTFLDLLNLGLSERPRELGALQRWLQAFTPDMHEWPGNFSVLSVRVTRLEPPRVSLYLRPVEFEIGSRISRPEEELAEPAAFRRH